MKISGVYEIINTINGHRYIGSADNMRVRWNLHKQHYQKMKHLLHAKHKIVCDQCGIEYYAEKGRFCSNACKSKWRRNNGLDNVMRKCVVCGSEFVTNKYSDTVTCSRSCGRTLGWRSAEGE